MPGNSRKNRIRVGARRRRRNRIIILIFVLLLILCTFAIMRAVVSLPFKTVDLSKLALVEFSGFNGDGVATVTTDEEAVDRLLSSVKKAHEDSWYSTSDVEDIDFASFRQSLSYSIPNSMGLSNGDTVNIVAEYDKELAKKLKIDVISNSKEVTVEGLKDVKKIPVDEVFKDLDVSFTGISPRIEISLANKSTQPLVSKMIFEIVDPKEFYSEGETVAIHAIYNDEMVEETGYAVDRPSEDCIKEYVAKAQSSYVTSVDQLPSSVVREAIEAGKRAFTNANEYGVRVFIEANLVPVYINKQATFSYGSPGYVSAYFKTVFPEKAGDLGLSYNDLDIIYEVTISQADGQSCTAYGAVRFSDIVINSDGSLSYDFSSPSIMSMSYYSARVKKNVVDAYKTTHDIERVGP